MAAQAADRLERVGVMARDAADAVVGRGGGAVEADRRDLDARGAHRCDPLVGQERRHARREGDRKPQRAGMLEQAVQAGTLEHVAAGCDEHRPRRSEAGRRVEQPPCLGVVELAGRGTGDRLGAAVAAGEPAGLRRLPEDEDRPCVEVERGRAHRLTMRVDAAHRIRECHDPGRPRRLARTARNRRLCWTSSLTRRSAVTPASTLSPGLRARTESAIAPPGVCASCGMPVSVIVAMPSLSVAISAGCMIEPNGSAVTWTSAPCTGCLNVSTTVTFAVTVPEAEIFSGEKLASAITSRFGSVTLSTGIDLRPSARVTAPVSIGPVTWDVHTESPSPGRPRSGPSPARTGCARRRRRSAYTSARRAGDRRAVAPVAADPLVVPADRRGAAPVPEVGRQRLADVDAGDRRRRDIPRRVGDCARGGAEPATMSAIAAALTRATASVVLEEVRLVALPPGPGIRRDAVACVFEGRV